DCSFKGGPPGFVQVLSPGLLAFPDYDGNGMFKSLGNILANTNVGLLFIMMGEKPQRLRVNGRASVHTDDPLLTELPGAQAVVRVVPEHIFPNCPRYIPDLAGGRASDYLPCEGVEAKEPAWKGFDMFKDVVPPRRRYRRRRASCGLRGAPLQRRGADGPVPGQWPERIVRALSGEGVALPSHIAPWRAMADAFFVYLAPVYAFALLAQVVDMVQGFATTGVLQLPESGERRYFLAFALVVVPAAVAYYLTFRPLHVMSPRRLRMAFRGTNALHETARSKYPPILYLRSFPFDERATATGKWMGRIERNFGFGLIQDDTAEMKVVRALRRFGPVLAIGRPGELREPPGALRFYVRDDLWQSKIEEIAPACQLVVLATGNSAGLRWELEHVARVLDPHRVLVWPHVDVGQHSAQQRQNEWKRLEAQLRDVLPQPLPSWDRVRKAHFIAFDAQWAPICIPSEAFRPPLWERLVTRPSICGLTTFMRQLRSSSRNLDQRT
ncbi:MAG: pyridoxamine 5'-phosphate oxidase family protein, partial [Vicinamibacterales bacterium]